jgi:CelD/BcsL family acetyltransferase involved in cellulose biosynthesis
MEFEKTSFHNFFQTIDYIKEVIKKNDSQIKIVILYKNNLIISILPLEIKKYFFFKVLQWIGTGKSDLCNPIISNYFGSDIDEKKFIKTWDNILNKLGGFDLIFFNNQPAKIEEISNPFVDFLKTNIFSKVYQIELSNSFNEYKENIKKKDKKHFYELHRTLIKESNLKEKFKVIFLPKDLNNDEIKFKDIIQNKLIQLENKNIKHNLNKEITNIYENLIKKKADRFFLINLEVEKETVAICFGIIYKNIFYYYMPMLISNNFNNYSLVYRKKDKKV